MKQKIYNLGLITLMVVFLGIIFKLNHWPGSGYMLVLGIFLLVFVFLPMALISNYKMENNKKKKALYYITWLTCMVVFVSMLFKIMHWPGAGWAILVSLPFPYLVYLPFYLYITKRDPNHSIYHTVAVLFLLVFISAFSALLSLNVSKNKIEDSLLLAANCNHVTSAISTPSKAEDSSLLIRKIDDLLKLAVQYRKLDLQYYGINSEEWNNNPQVFLDSARWSKWPRPKASGQLLQQEEEIKTKFLEEVQDLIFHLENIPEHSNLAVLLPELLGLEKLPSGLFIWKPDIAGSTNFPWFMIYLSQVEINLKLIRLTL